MKTPQEPDIARAQQPHAGSQKLSNGGSKDFPGGPVAKTPNAGGLIPGQGTRSHLLQLKILRASPKIPHVAMKMPRAATKTWYSKKKKNPNNVEVLKYKHHFKTKWVQLLATHKPIKRQSCLTLSNPEDYTVHGILQARILEWVAFPFSRGSSQPRD